MSIKLYLYNKSFVKGREDIIMPLELIKEFIEVDQEIKRIDTQTMIEEDVIVPDLKPDIEKILSVKGNIHVNNKVVEDHKFYVEGVVDCLILYQSGEEGIKLQNINVEIPFSHWIEVKEEENLQSIITTNIEHMDYQLINTRKINIRGILGMKGKLIKKEQFAFLKDVKGSEDMQVLHNWIKLTRIADKSSEQIMAKEGIQLEEDMPEILEILKTQGRIVESEVKMTEGKMMVHGSLEVGILYIGEREENQSIEYIEARIPITEHLEIPNINSTMEYQLNFNIEEILTHIESDIEGNFNIIDLEALITIENTLYETLEVESIVDAYSSSIQTALHRKKINAYEIVGTNRAQESLKENILSSKEEQIESILSMEGIVKITRSEKMMDKWVVEGVIETELLYKVLGEEESYGNIKREIPFENIFALESNKEMDGDVAAYIHRMEYELVNSNEIELKILVDINCQLFKPVVFEVINEIEELEFQEEENDQAKISVYFKQPEDTLWDIAKRYRIKIEDILKQNDMKDKAQLEDFSPLIIFKKNKHILK